jgi:hypothetical protein
LQIKQATGSADGKQTQTIVLRMMSCLRKADQRNF